MFEKTIARIFRFFKINQKDVTMQVSSAYLMAFTSVLHEVTVLMIDQRNSKEDVHLKLRLIQQNLPAICQEQCMRIAGIAPKTVLYEFSRQGSVIIPSFVEVTVKESGRTDLTWFVKAAKEIFKIHQ